MTSEKADRIERIVAIGLTAALAALLIVRLANVGALWRDEISTLAMATLPSVGAMWRQLFIDPFPIGFFLVLRGWHALVGDNDFNLRVLGCVIAVAVIGAMWISARLCGRRTPLLAIALLGLCPTFYIWAATLRGYGFALIWIVLLFGAFWRALETPRLRNFAVATVCAVLAVQSAYTAAFAVFGCGIAGVLLGARARNWRSVAGLLAACAISAASLLPYVPVITAATPWASAYRINYSLGNSLHMFTLALVGTDHALFWFWVLATVAALGVLIMRRATRLTAYALFAAGISMMSTLAYFRWVGWGTNPWYYLPALAIAACAIDAALDQPSIRLLSLGRSIFVILLLVLWTPLVASTIYLRLTNMDVIAGTIGRSAAPEDLVVICPHVEALTFERYYRGKAACAVFPPLHHFPIAPTDDVLVEMRQPNSLGPLLERIAEKLKAGGHVWFASAWPPPPPRPAPEIVPLRPNDTRPASHFLRRWHETILFVLRNHTVQQQAVDLRLEEPVASYEDARLYRFSGWRD